jgi:hypothetical protein
MIRASCRTCVVAMALFAAAPAMSRGPAESLFRDAAREAGLDFTFRSHATGALHLQEIMGPGVGLLDFDNDGDLDVVLPQGAPIGPKGEPLPATEGPRLFRNDLTIGRGGQRSVRFVDVTDALGLTPGGFGVGVAAGDYDGDGWVDLYLLEYGANRLFRNIQGRRFEDVTRTAGVSDPGWSVSASFFDYDRDGRLDLFVTHYVEYRPHRCVQASTRPDYCGPKSFAPERDTLFHNLGGGRFEDVSRRVLGARREGAGLGVVSGDYDGDGWPDLYVANDGSDNHLWLNQAGRTLRESGLLSGAALSSTGIAKAGMGTDAGDVDGDGNLDLFVTNLVSEGNALYVNIGGGLFEDRSRGSGLAAPSLPWTGFGARFIDYDNDGVLDLPVVNGAVHLKEAWSSVSVLGEPMQLYRGIGGGRFEDVTARAGAAFARRDVSRGLATGDVDNDGDTDLLIGNTDTPVRLLLNDTGQQQAWIGLRLVEADGRRDAYGARVVLRRRGAPDLVRHVHADGSYASTSDPRLLFGLSQGRDIIAIDVTWPGGNPGTSHETFAVPPLRTYSTLRRGTGTAGVAR